MLVIGLTGNIGAGKSTVARHFAEWGATVIDADVLARDAVAPGTPALAAIVERWGAGVLDPAGGLDRAALRHIVFADPAERAALDSIVHPAVASRRSDAVAAARARGDRLVVADIPLLFEAGLADTVDAIVLVDAPRAVRRDRLLRDRGLDGADADAMMAAQWPSDRKRPRADFIIENDGDWATLRARARTVYDALVARAASP
ncbi:MAG: dephospho-CoA kinase [Gemmatimonadaceae bacterium]|nr:dephospho-CoA kinase [Gemmatimonadaceae bacterium]